MSGSDVKAVFITADTQALDADGISVAAAVGNNAALVIGGALASGGACAFDSGRIVTILSAGNDSAKSFTVNAAAGEVIFAGRARMQGLSIVCSATAGTISFATTTPAGTSLLKVGSVAAATSTRDVTIPDEGIVFSAGMFVQYTVSTFGTMTVFHA